jgi:ATP-dependent Clp protease, protease subunit
MPPQLNRRVALRTAATGALALGISGFAKAETAPTTTYLIFQGGISAQSVNQLLATAAQVTTDELYIGIASGGGDVTAGIAAYSFLRSLPRRVITHNISNVASIATVLFMAGERRFSSPLGTFLFHGVKSNLTQNSALSTFNLQELVNSHRAFEQQMNEVISQRTKLTGDQINRFFLESKTMDANEALASGVIEKIADMQIPAGAPRITIVGSNERSDPGWDFAENYHQVGDVEQVSDETN